MDFEELRAFIAQAAILPKAQLKADKRKKYDAIFLVEKPEEIEASKFIVYNFNELNGGKDVRHFAVTLKICCTDAPSVISIKDSLINLLNFYDRPCEITDYVKFVFSNDGGIYFDKESGLYINKLFFECKLI